MPTPGVPIQITYDGSAIDPSDDDGHTGVVFAPTTFHAEMNAVPGTCEIWVRDPHVVYDFQTGKEIVLSIDGTPRWGGYVTQISRKHFFPDSKSPLWVLRGVDYNILFDKRVIRNPDNYVSQIDNLAGDTMDGTALKQLLSTYSDMSGFGTSNIDDIVCVSPRANIADDCDPDQEFAWPNQGERIRVAFEDFARFSRAFFFIDGGKEVYYRSAETFVSDWGFSDTPDDSTYYGFRDAEMIEDGSGIINDALVWGGSELAGAGGTVFDREQDTGSQTDHGRWQLGETHLGEVGYGLQDGVTARAKAIIDGPPGVGSGGGGPETIEQKGLKFPQWVVNSTWFHHRVPDFLVPGSIVPLNFSIFDEIQNLPLRSIDITFPTLDGAMGAAADRKSYVQYRGTFSIQSSDPFGLWAILMRLQFRKVKPLLGAANNDTINTVFGAYGSFSPTNVSGLIYKIPFGYVSGTLLVYSDGLLLTPGVDFHETDHLKGKFTLESSPGVLYATCRTLSS